jgi:multidrug efflux pump subunit AcrA (membrane-fusion protein)
MTLFRPEVITAQRRRVFGSVTLHQPARLIAFTAVAVIGMAVGTVYLSLGTFAKKETVVGWVVPQAGLVQITAMRGGMVAAVAVGQGDYVRRGQTLVVLDTSEQGGSVWGNRVPVSSTLLTAPVDGQVVALAARVGEQATPGAPLLSVAPQGSPMEAQVLVPTRAAGFISEGQAVRVMVDALPYQQYGVMAGRVREIARSASRPGEFASPIDFKEPVYRVRVALTGPNIVAYGVDKPLQAGMTLKADVITDKRTFMSWLLDPLLAARARAKVG